MQCLVTKMLGSVSPTHSISSQLENVIWVNSTLVQTNVERLTNDDSSRPICVESPHHLDCKVKFTDGSFLNCFISIVITDKSSPVIWIVMSNARMRSVTNYFIINLSMADIINATFNVIPNFTYMLTGNWPFGEISARQLNACFLGLDVG